MFRNHRYGVMVLSQSLHRQQIYWNFKFFKVYCFQINRLFYFTDHSLEDFQFSFFYMFEQVDEWNVFHGNHKPMSGVKAFFFIWKLKTVRHAKWLLSRKMKTNNEKKTIQLWGIYTENEKEKFQGLEWHFQTLRQKEGSE